jgi:hypothetical protein
MRRLAFETSKESIASAHGKSAAALRSNWVHPAERRGPVDWLVGLKAAVFNDDGGPPSEARAGELRLEAPLPQRAQQRIFQEVRQADQLQVGQGRDDKNTTMSTVMRHHLKAVRK